ncbi:Gp37-like protein [Microcella alkaliphila]|uniref:Uncharacterized protein n=1 Tax=Microcella alkaliphila TaxID=279828 RepID=A0A0U4NW20_9MICO|nr:tail fiber protein [Microcella alkaliphila]BAU32451.1 uncharacterized protein MalAC0309_1600 [Microcella alkaliphila]
MIVEVRNAEFEREGQIDRDQLDIMFVETFRDVGAWELKLPAEHPLLPVLRGKGSGIIIRDGSQVFSGRTRRAILSTDPADPKGTWVISGVDDAVILAATSALPDPANAPNAQTQDRDRRNGPAETIMKEFVRANAGDLATPERSYPWLDVAPDLGRGDVLPESARFQSLLEILQRIGTNSGLGFRVAQTEIDGQPMLRFDVYEPTDRRDEIKMSIANEMIDKASWGYQGPNATHLFVGGKGSGADRTIKVITTDASLQQAEEWGMRWELFQDRRDTDEEDELEQAGLETLAENGEETSIDVVPADAPSMAYGVDWGLGDLVTVIVDGQPTAAIVTQVARYVGPDGDFVRARVGEPTGFNFTARMARKVEQQDKRIRQLELSAAAVAAATTIPVGAHLPGEWSTSAVPAGFLLPDGTVYNIADYPALAAHYANVYGIPNFHGGNGLTTFAVPDTRERVYVNQGGSDIFAAIGAKTGAKTHSLTESEMPAHAHNVTGTLSLVVTAQPSSATAGPSNNGLSAVMGGTGGRFTHQVAAFDSSGPSNLVAQNQGNGAAHNNVQPSFVCRYVIRAA